MAGVLDAWTRRLLAARAGRPAELPPSPHGRRLVGGPAVVSRLQMVPASTVALRLLPGRAAELRRPGDVLGPPLLRLGADAVVLVVATTPVRLAVTVPDTLTFDGHPLELVTVQLSVQVDERHGFAGLRQLVDAHGAGLEAELLTSVQREVTAAVQAAVRMNRLADLRRLSLAEVLRMHWWPTRFADGVLACQEFSVDVVPQAASSADEPTIPLPLAAS